MPLYEYNCEKCKYNFDRLVMSMDSQVKCPICQGDVQKLMSTFSVGAPDNVADNLPPSMAPKMCTNC
ncbi:MAG: FmdB family zinc ribbon protein [Planctomycetota bacterium]